MKCDELNSLLQNKNSMSNLTWATIRLSMNSDGMEEGSISKHPGRPMIGFMHAGYKEAAKAA